MTGPSSSQPSNISIQSRGVIVPPFYRTPLPASAGWTVRLRSASASAVSAPLWLPGAMAYPALRLLRRNVGSASPAPYHLVLSVLRTKLPIVTPGTLPQQAVSSGVADDPQPERVHGVLS